MPPCRAALTNPLFDAMQRAGKTLQVSTPSAKFPHTQDPGLRLVVHRSPFLPHFCQRRGAPEVQGRWSFLSLPFSQSVAWARYSWWRTISVPSWGWLGLATSGVGQPPGKETASHQGMDHPVFPAGG